MTPALLLDEFTQPSLKHAIGGLMACAEQASFAVSNVRLGAIDLDPAALAGLRSCRLLLGSLDVSFQLGAGNVLLRPEMASRLGRLAELARMDRIEVRAAGVDRWLPDYSVFEGLRRPIGGAERAMLFGAHYFELPYPTTGVALTALITDAAAVEHAATRFEQLWERAHDVLPVIVETIDQMLTVHHAHNTA